jgi:hypothetical protein
MRLQTYRWRLKLYDSRAIGSCRAYPFYEGRLLHYLWFFEGPFGQTELSPHTVAAVFYTNISL